MKKHSKCLLSLLLVMTMLVNVMQGGQINRVRAEGESAHEVQNETEAADLGYFNVSADLVDYFNDNRVVNSNANMNDNQGNQTGEGQAPFSRFNQWLSGLPGYAISNYRTQDVPEGMKTIYFSLDKAVEKAPYVHFWDGPNIHSDWVTPVQMHHTYNHKDGRILWYAFIPEGANQCLFLNGAPPAEGKWENKYTGDLTIGGNCYQYNLNGNNGFWTNYTAPDLPSESVTPVPLYFGCLINSSQGGGPLSWYYKAANVALDVNNTYNTVASGIVGEHLVNGDLVMSNSTGTNSIYMPMFKENTYPGQSDYMAFYKNLKLPFSKTRNNDVTTYSFDSNRHKVYYNYETGELVRDDNINYSVSSESKPGYFPLNTSAAASGGDSVNCGFGMKLTIPFIIPEDGMDANGEPVTFKFTGDDDVWVFIDGALVLDMGGAHAMAQGEIDFHNKKSQVTTGVTDARQSLSDNAGGRAEDCTIETVKDKLFDDIMVQIPQADGSVKEQTLSNYLYEDDGNLPAENRIHTLTMFYMERGMLDSNMSVEFSFTPLPSGLSLSKDVNTAAVNPGLQDTVKEMDSFNFSVTDNHTDNASYEYDRANQKNGQRDENVKTNGNLIEALKNSVYAANIRYSDGSRLVPGTQFTITEQPGNTIGNYDTRWFVTNLSNGQTTNTAEDEGATPTCAKFQFGESADEGDLLATANYNVNFVNTPKVSDVEITKNWEGSSQPEKPFEFTVLVDLDGNGTKYDYEPYSLTYLSGEETQTTDENGKFEIAANEAVTFKGILVGAKIKAVETIPEDAKWKITTQNNEGTVTENETLELSITNTSLVTELNKVIYLETGKETTYKPEGITLTSATVTDEKGEKSQDLTVDTANSTFKAVAADRKFEVKYEGKKTAADGALSYYEGTITVYTFCATDKAYVFDYGLDSDLAATNDNGNGLFQGGVFYNSKAENTADDTTAKLNTIKGDGANTQTTIINPGNVSIQKDGSIDSGKVIFRPIRFMDHMENYTYDVQITREGAQADETIDAFNPEEGTMLHGTIKVMPANVVYYEDNFASSGTDADGSNGIIINGNHSNETSSGSGYNGEQSNSLDIQYGYDEAYTDDSELSNGSATVLNKGASAFFQFNGTGFDIISRTNIDSGTVQVSIYDGTLTEIVTGTRPNGDFVKVVEKGTTALANPISRQLVNIYYENGDLYQVPVISKKDLQYGNYIVKVMATGLDTEKTVYLDGIRIYNPAKDDENVIKEYLSAEKYAEVLEVRTMILGTDFVFDYENPAASTEGTEKKATLVQWPGNGNTKFLTGVTVTENFTGAYYEGTPSEENSKTDNLLTYAIQGPNNELYLEDDYAFAFRITPIPAAEAKTLQIGVKRVSGNPRLMYLNKEGTWVSVTGTGTVDSATELYYEIPVDQCYGDIVALGVKGDPGDVLSFTNVKYAGYEFAPLGSNDMQTIALTTPGTGLVNTTDVTVLAPLQRDNFIITFAATEQVVGIEAVNQSTNEIVPIETSSYVFNAGPTYSNTWTVRFPAEKGEKYTLKAYTKDGTFCNVKTDIGY